MQPLVSHNVPSPLVLSRIGLLCKRTTRTVNSDLQKKEVEPETDGLSGSVSGRSPILRTKFRRSAATTRHGLSSVHFHIFLSHLGLLSG